MAQAGYWEFEASVAPHMRELRLYCLSLTGSAWDAEDLYQEALLKLWRYSRKHRGKRLSKALLMKAAKHLWIDQHRRRRGLTEQLPLEQAVFAEQPADYASVRSLVEWLDEHLSARDMRMLLLADVYGYTYAEIAEALACTVSAVRMALHRARRTLKTSGARSARAGSDGSSGRAADIDRWTEQLMAYPGGRSITVTLFCS